MALKIPDKGEIENGELSYRKIIEYINDQYIHIPDFQRKFVWTKHKILDLLDSIYKGYPIGSFIFWVADKDFIFSKPIDKKNKNIGVFDKKFFVIDGQQRLRSLYTAAKSEELEMKKENSSRMITQKIVVLFNLDEKNFLFKEDITERKNRNIPYIPELKGSELIFDTLKSIINGDLENIVDRYKIKMDSLEYFIEELEEIGIVKSKEDDYELTEIGIEIFQDRNYERIAGILFGKFLFIREAMVIICDNPGITRQDAVPLFHKIYGTSEDTAYAQFARRCLWLQALKLLNKEDKSYYLTDVGKDFLKDMTQTEKERRTRNIPLDKILADEGDLDLEFLMDCSKERQKEISELRRRFTNYKFSIIVVNKDDREDVCEIFERINTMGTSLTVVDLMIAKTWSEKFNLRDKLIEFKKEIGEEDLPDMTILQTLSINICGKCRRGDILSLNSSQVIENWNESIESFRKALRFVKNIINLPSLKIIPYPSLMVPISKFYFMYGNKEPTNEQIKKLKQWFWKASISNRFDSAVESKLKDDSEYMVKLFRKEPFDIRYSFITRSIDDIIEQKHSLANAFSKTILCMLASQNPRNPINNDPILGSNFSKYTQSEMHHIFPQNYLRKKDVDDYRINSIANIMFLPANVNKGKKFKEAPATYIKSIDNQELDKTLKTHLINNLKESGLLENHYETFLRYRAKQIIKKLKEVSGEEQAFVEGKILSPETPFTNEMYFREIIRKSESYILWFDKFFTRKGLEFLSQDINTQSIKKLKILTGTKQTTPSLKNDFKKFKKEMENNGIKTEMRVLSSEDSAEIHDRWIISENQIFNIPSINTIGRNQYTEIKKSASEPPFDIWWKKGIDILKNWNKIQKMLNKD